MCVLSVFFFFKQKTAYEMRISDWSSDVCSSDLRGAEQRACAGAERRPPTRLEDARHAFVDRVDRPHAAFEQRREDHQLEQDVEPRDQIGRASCRERGCQYV